jgi:murein tripeptide amidase MpaA
LKKIQSEHPSLVEMFSIGKSTEGREIMGVKISDKSITTPKKTIWVSSHQHAREVRKFQKN